MSLNDNFLLQWCDWRRTSLVIVHYFAKYLSDCYWTFFPKTNTHLIHTIFLHSIARKIRHLIQIVVHQFERKTTTKNNSVGLKKIAPPWSPGTREYVESVLRSPVYMQNTWKKMYTIWIIQSHKCTFSQPLSGRSHVAEWFSDTLSSRRPGFETSAWRT